MNKLHNSFLYKIFTDDNLDHHTEIIEVLAKNGATLDHDSQTKLLHGDIENFKKALPLFEPLSPNMTSPLFSVVFHVKDDRLHNSNLKDNILSLAKYNIDYFFHKTGYAGSPLETLIEDNHYHVVKMLFDNNVLNSENLNNEDVKSGILNSLRVNFFKTENSGTTKDKELHMQKLFIENKVFLKQDIFNEYMDKLVISQFYINKSQDNTKNNLLSNIKWIHQTLSNFEKLGFIDEFKILTTGSSNKINNSVHVNNVYTMKLTDQRIVILDEIVDGQRKHTLIQKEFLDLLEELVILTQTNNKLNIPHHIFPIDYIIEKFSILITNSAKDSRNLSINSEDFDDLIQENLTEIKMYRLDHQLNSDNLASKKIKI